MRFFLVDKVIELVPGDSIKGVKCWSLDNEIFRDHFPGFPTTPGVLLTESMAQLAGILLEHSYYAAFGKEVRVYPILSIIQKAKFRSFVSPGDRCEIEASLISVDRGLGSAKVVTKVEGELVCEATLNYFIGLEHDMKYNRFIEKRDEYYQNILPEEFLFNEDH